MRAQALTALRILRPKVILGVTVGGSLLFGVQATSFVMVQPVVLVACTLIFFGAAIGYVAVRSVDGAWFWPAVLNVGIAALLAQALSRPLAVLSVQILSMLFAIRRDVAWESPIPHLTWELVVATAAGVVVLTALVGPLARLLRRGRDTSC